MKKLLIFIPCLNEEKNLKTTFNAIPKNFSNILETEVVVVDDCSIDNTIEEAKKLNLKIISHKNHVGLSKVFNSMVDYFNKSKFDLMCVLDADNQYSSKDINILIDEMREKELDMIVGSRKILENKIMSRSKKFFQILGSWIVSMIIGYKISDVTSGFRIYKRKCFEEGFYVENNFSYTIESLIIFSWKRLKIGSKLINTNEGQLRESRLFKSNSEYIKKQTYIIIKNFNKYFPLKFFSIIATLFLIPGILISFRYLFIFFAGGGGHIQSLILSAILIISSLIIFVMGILSNSISNVSLQLKNLNNQKKDSHYSIINNDN